MDLPEPPYDPNNVPDGPPEEKKRSGRGVAAVILVIAILGGITAVTFLWLRPGTPVAKPTPSPSVEPKDYVTQELLDSKAEAGMGYLMAGQPQAIPQLATDLQYGTPCTIKYGYAITDTPAKTKEIRQKAAAYADGTTMSAYEHVKSGKYHYFVVFVKDCEE